MANLTALLCALLLSLASVAQCQDAVSLDMCSVVPPIFCCSSPALSACSMCAGLCGDDGGQRRESDTNRVDEGGDEDTGDKADSKYFLSDEEDGSGGKSGEKSGDKSGDKSKKSKQKSKEKSKQKSKSKSKSKSKEKSKEKKKKDKGEGKDEQIDECCKKEKKIAKKCHQYCNFKAFNKNTLKDMYLKETCPRSDLLDWYYCVTDERDHQDCCKSAGVQKLCLPFCNPKGGLPKLSSKYLPCLEEFGKMRKCFKKGYNTAPKG